MDRDTILSALYDACHSSTSLIDCEGCGRTHFNDEAVPELGEDLETLAKKYPDKYIDHGDYPIAWLTYKGQQLVPDCPCDTAVKLAENLWSERFLVAKILTNLAQATIERAESDKEVHTKMKEGLSKISP